MPGPNPLAHPMAPNPQELATARANAEDEGREGAVVGREDGVCMLNELCMCDQGL